MQGVMFSLDGRGYGNSRQYGFLAKDHLRENVRRMRQIQRSSKQKEADSHQPVKALWKSEKYSSITSKIKDDLEKEPPPPRPQSANFLRAHSRSGPTVPVQSRPCTPDPSSKVSVPTAADCSEVKLKRNNVDFIRSNGMSVKHVGMKKSPSLTHLDELREKQNVEMANYHKGAVPKYLRNRQAQWKKEEEERVLNTPDPAMPPGHRALPEQERRETLELLKQKEQSLVRELQALPIRTDTFRVRTAKKEVETKIAEVEEAIKIFSRPKVYVKVEP